MKVATSASAVVLAALALVSCDDRAPESALYGTWEIDDHCIDCTHWITLKPNHTVVGFTDSLGKTWLDYHGRWYAGGQTLVIHYDDAEKAGSAVFRLLDIAPDTVRVKMSGQDTTWKRSSRTPPQTSNQALQLT